MTLRVGCGAAALRRMVTIPVNVSVGLWLEPSVAADARVSDLKKASIAAARSICPAPRLRVLCNGKELDDSTLLSAEVLPYLRGASNRYVVLVPASPVNAAAAWEVLVPSRKQSKSRRPSFAAQDEVLKSSAGNIPRGKRTLVKRAGRWSSG